MKKGGGFAKGRVRQVRKRIVVATEGTVTEVQYLEGLLQELRARGAAVSTVKVQTVGRDPQKVVKAAIDRNASDPDGFDEVWAVVDVDDHARLGEAVNLARDEQVSLVVSNPCFELWLLWHYQDQRAFSTKAQIDQALKKHGHAGGQKFLPHSFPFAAYAAATERSRAAPCLVSTVNANPSSTVSHLIESILRVEDVGVES